VLDTPFQLKSQRRKLTPVAFRKHVLRKHCLPPSCNRCGATFGTNIDLRSHELNTFCFPGDKQTRDPEEGITRNMELELRGRMVINNWETLWGVIFPEDEEVGSSSINVLYHVFLVRSVMKM